MQSFSCLLSREHRIQEGKVVFPLGVSVQGDVVVSVYHMRSTIGGRLQAKVRSSENQGITEILLNLQHITSFLIIINYYNHSMLLICINKSYLMIRIISKLGHFEFLLITELMSFKKKDSKKINKNKSKHLRWIY